MKELGGFCGSENSSSKIWIWLQSRHFVPKLCPHSGILGARCDQRHKGGAARVERLKAASRQSRSI